MTLGRFGHFHLKAWAVLSKHHTSSLSSLFQTHCSISPHDPRCPYTSSFVAPVITSDHSISLWSLPSSSTSSSQLSSIPPICPSPLHQSPLPSSNYIQHRPSVHPRCRLDLNKRESSGDGGRDRELGERGRNIRDKGNRIDDMKKKQRKKRKYSYTYLCGTYMKMCV